MRLQQQRKQCAPQIVTGLYLTCEPNHASVAVRNVIVQMEFNKRISPGMSSIFKHQRFFRALSVELFRNLIQANRNDEYYSNQFQF